MSPSLFNGLQMGFASGFLLLLSLLLEHGSISLHQSFAAWTSIIYLGIVASILASNVYYWLIRESDALFPSTWTIISPIIASMAGVMFLGERFTMYVLIGALFSITGLLIMNANMFRGVYGRSSLARRAEEL
ncbi:EamA family transporter [Paenibacillus thermotolerans]|uniref:EamA family transporter n=1 Tax=Paenibacillus thermotolerans TaxID=3027807 RepID=UPI003CC5A047